MNAEELLHQWRFLVFKIVNKFQRFGLDIDIADLEQEALIALWKAAVKWNPKRMEFGLWASLCIRRRLYEYCEHEANSVIKIPRYVRQVELRVYRLMRKGVTKEEAIKREIKLPTQRHISEKSIEAKVRQAMQLKRVKMPTDVPNR